MEKKKELIKAVGIPETGRTKKKKLQALNILNYRHPDDHLFELVNATPVALDVEFAGILPEVVGVGEEDGLRADLLNESLDSGGLLGGTGDSLAVGVTLAGPAGLKVDHVLVADGLKVLDLGADEGTGLVGGNIGVEEGVEVSAKDVNGTAESAARLLPDVDGLGGGDLARVAGGLEGGLARGDEASEAGGISVTVLDGLVTDDDEGNQIPLGPLADGGHLLLGTANAGAGDEDTNDQLEAVLTSSLTDVLETVAVSRVDTDVGEALLLDQSNILEDLVLGLAATLVGVRRVGHTHLLAADTSGDRGGRAAGASAARGDGGAGGGGSSGGHRDGRGGGSNGGGGGLVVAGEGADIGEVGAGDGYGLLILGVGAWGDGGRSGVDHDGAGRHVGGGGGNGVGTSAGADIGGGVDLAGDSGTAGLNGGDGAGNGGRGGDNSGHTTEGVRTAGQLSGGSTADGGGVPHGNGGGGDGVDTGGGEAGHSRGGERGLGDSGSRGFRGSSRSGGLRGARDTARGSLNAGGINTRSGDHGDGGSAGGVEGGDGLGGHDAAAFAAGDAGDAGDLRAAAAAAAAGLRSRGVDGDHCR